MTRTRSALGFGAILVASLGGAFYLSPWLVVATAATLMLLSLTQHAASYGRYAREGNALSQSLLLAGSTLNALTATIVAFSIGRVIGWLWGV